MQKEVAKDIARQIQEGSKKIAGVMIESFIKEGCQKLTDNKKIIYGKSITDPCLGWKDSQDILASLADAVDSRL
jgi:3-deoxy-7-phosphoheptulonate synthase